MFTNTSQCVNQKKEDKLALVCSSRVFFFFFLVEGKCFQVIRDKS